jgi:hypothetical protein
MHDGLSLEYLASLEHNNRINDPDLTRRAQLQRELTLMAGTGGPSARVALAGIGLVFSRIGRVFSAPRPVAGQA